VLEVPYKSVGAEIPDLLSGQVTAGFLVPNTVGGPIKAGKLRALAVAGPQRLAILPEIPTTAEAGLPGVEAIAWNGIFVPAGTPQPLIQILHRERARSTRPMSGNRSRTPARTSPAIARGIRRVHPCRSRKVGQGDPRRRHQGAMNVV
jgi:hypothetical protein